MKQRLYILIGIVIFGAGVLTACGKSGSSSAPATTPTNAITATCDAMGTCSGGSGYIGGGRWYTQRMMVSNATAYRQFALENRLCYQTNGDCQYLSNYFQFVVTLPGNGCLPDTGNFQIIPHSNNYNNYGWGGWGGYYQQQYWNQGQLYRQTDANLNSTRNGFVLSYINPYSNTNNDVWFPGYPQPQPQPVNNTNSTLTINVVFADGVHQTANVQVIYRGTQIATGVVYGQSNYTAAYASNPTLVCGYGYGGIGGYPFGTLRR